MKYAIAILMVILGITGCRTQDEAIKNAVTYNAGRDIILTESGTSTEALQEGHLTAGKEYDDVFSGNKPEVAAGPLSRTGGSEGDNK